MFALESLLFGCFQHFLVFRMFDISDVCHGQAGFRMFAVFFWFFGCLTYRMFALVKLVFACLQHFLVNRMFDISDICPGKFAFRMFPALFDFSDI